MPDLRDKIRIFLQAEFPQIQMHGGSFEIQKIDEDDGVVELFLGDACGGCGLSPMTQTAIQRRMPKSIEEIEIVRIEFEEVDDITAGPF